MSYTLQHRANCRKPLSPHSTRRLCEKHKKYTKNKNKFNNMVDDADNNRYSLSVLP